MASLRDIQRKIGAVKKTKQITKAMNMVASAKLRSAQLRIERFRPYAEKYYETLSDLTARVDASVHPLLERREEIVNVGIILVTSDKGLCGSFNTNLCTKARKLADAKAAEGKTVKMICIGKKGNAFFRKRGYEIVTAKNDAMNNFDFFLANQIGTELIEKYLAAEFDEVHIVFGSFVSMAKQVPESAQILPVAPAEEEEGDSSSEYIFEPSVEGLLAELLPRYVKVQVYRGLLDTSASEHAARMSSMDNATKNCDDLVNKLTLVYNKARQATITRELMDIVGGAEALKKG
ncbi:MAG: F0F1 ATP synthase subunit gamma [Deltaproteobacteria bacterium]|nr:F0F1 ATP synthase subunit gamma [Deltaproteobacteria bacterium]